jgi:hypothetical protein
MTAGFQALKDCTLLFATPVSREEFERACERIPRSDYVAHVVGDNPEEAWNSSYANVVRAAQELIATAGALGAVIHREARLQDFAQATANATVVILLAHFRGFDFAEEDLIASREDLIRAIETRAHPVLSYFRPRLSQPESWVDVLNEAVMNRDLLSYLPSPLRDSGELSVAIGRVLCRDLLDEALQGLVKTGNQVDLVDGLYTLGAMEAAIAQGFSGELDLALCNSEALGTYIDLSRGNQVHHLHWPDLIDPVPQLLLIAETLRRLSRSGGSYITARLNLESEMLELDGRTHENRRHP